LKNPYPKWRNEHILFLDDAFDCQDAFDLLTEAGYKVLRFTQYFSNPVGKRAQGIKDPEVIRLVNSLGCILITTDGDMVNRHPKEIEKAKDLGILATSHNTVDDPAVWARAVIKLKPLIEKNNFRKRQRPWFVKFDKTGKFTSAIRHLSAEAPFVSNKPAGTPRT
jgi:hypothetical protein